MNSKFFEKMDGLPVVRLLQVSAIIIFAAEIVHLIETWHRTFGYINGINITSFFEALMATVMVLSKFLFEPMALLALAKIIQIKEK